MRTFKEIKENYRFTPEHEKRLSEMRPLMEEHAEEVLSTLSLWIMGTKGAAQFFTDESRQKHVFSAQRAWFLNLFSGKYDNQYHERLIRIGAAHVKHSVDAHFMNRAVNIVRNVGINILSRFTDDKKDLTDRIVSFEKVLDINLDVITGSYIEEELRTFSPVYKVSSTLIKFSEKFSQSMNLILVLALIGLSIGVVALFVRDVFHLFTGDLGQGIISALGSMLMLWLMAELMNTEISHLKGGRFRISVFIGVALVTFIRETMIATLKHEDTNTVYSLVAVILVIGFVYWLSLKAEEKGKQQ